MYKLILVDDDKALLESLYSFIDWNKYGFEVAAMLKNGMEALQYIENNHIDVVITDIRMPKMDGIELAGKLFESYPDIKIVFISAFRDFQYAKQAIKYKVVDYINKPILHQDVEEVLQQIYKSLERKSNSSDKNYEYKIIEDREKLFSGLLSSVILDADFFKEELAGVQIPYRPNHSKCVLAIFEIMGIERHLNEEWKNNKDKMYEAITKIVCVDTDEFCSVRLNFTENIFAALYVSRNNTHVPRQYTDKIIANLWKKYRLIAVNETFLEFNSFEELKEEVVAAKTEEMKYLNGKVVLRSDEQIFFEVEKYVDKHYHENITVEMFAKSYHFSEQYFGRLFKKITGKNFVDYLNEVRIEKAKVMILSGEKVETVCNRVGFGNRMTFVRQFLNYTGESPTQYRKNKMENE